MVKDSMERISFSEINADFRHCPTWPITLNQILSKSPVGDEGLLRLPLTPAILVSNQWYQNRLLVSVLVRYVRDGEPQKPEEKLHKASPSLTAEK